MKITDKVLAKWVKQAYNLHYSNWGGSFLATKRLYKRYHGVILLFHPGEVVYANHSDEVFAEKVVGVEIVDNGDLPGQIIHTEDIENPRCRWYYGDAKLLYRDRNSAELNLIKTGGRKP